MTKILWIKKCHIVGTDMRWKSSAPRVSRVSCLRNKNRGKRGIMFPHSWCQDGAKPYRLYTLKLTFKLRGIHTCDLFFLLVSREYCIFRRTSSVSLKILGEFARNFFKLPLFLELICAPRKRETFPPSTLWKVVRKSIILDESALHRVIDEERWVKTSKCA